MNSKQATYSAVLGITLANLRKEKNIEQGEMAKKMGLTQASYSRLEGGKSTFSIDQMYQAASALDIVGKELIAKVDRYSSHLNGGGIPIVPQVRRNTSQATKESTSNNEIPTFIAGAALGALLLGILSGK